MIATTISDGTEYSCSARASVAAFARQNSTPSAMRESVRKIVAVFRPRLGLFRRARDRVENVLFALRFLEQLVQLFARETLLLRELIDVRIDVGATD